MRSFIIKALRAFLLLLTCVAGLLTLSIAIVFALNGDVFYFMLNVVFSIAIVILINTLFLDNNT